MRMTWLAYHPLMMIMIMSSCHAEEEPPRLNEGTTRTHSVGRTLSAAASFSGNCTPYNNTQRQCTECKKGYFGEVCNKTCNVNCNLGFCNITTGACKYGCRNTSKHSNTSPWYGPDCSKSCSVNCALSNKCFRNGTCYLGCTRGMYGDMCDRPCPPTCQGNCSMKSGTCLGDCVHGYYGPYCNVSCPVNCKGGVCQKNGKCYNCTSGYRGDTCSKRCHHHCGTCHQLKDICIACVDGRYDNQCNLTCGHCDGYCDFRDGRCRHGCKHGYYGSHCNSSCNSNCRGSENRIECVQSTGHCVNGCVSGWYGDHCDRSCNSGCMDSQCDTSSGQCLGGCRDGYWGTFCNFNCPVDCLQCNQTDGQCITCVNNKYGSRCGSQCPVHCRHKTCYMDSSCIYGCVAGYYDSTCESRCHRHCSTCDRYNGTCLTCSPGWFGVDCKESANTALFNALVVLFLLSVVFVVVSIVYACIRKYCMEDPWNCWKVSRWPSRQPPDDTYSLPSYRHRSVCGRNMSRISKRLTLRDEKNNLLPSFSREEMSAFVLLNNRKSVDRCSVHNNILFKDNQILQYKKFSIRSMSQCSQLEECLDVRNGHSKEKALLSERYSFVSGVSGPDRELSSSLKVLNEEQLETSQDKETVDHSVRSSWGPGFEHWNIADLPDSTDTGRSVFPGYPVTSVYSDKVEVAPVEGSGDQEESCQPTPACTGQVAMERSFRPVPVNCHEFSNYVRMMHHGGLDTEFKILPKGKLAGCVEAGRPENRSKNRYTNIHPYDHSRVVLCDRDCNSDYINASYINGYGKPKFFIAAQGPFGAHIDIFLKMVYQTRATTIIMLTNLFENNLMKCGQYWPDEGSSDQFGYIRVHTSQEEIKRDYCIRSMLLEQEGGEKHALSQYHYTAWPDHGHPTDPNSLLDFYWDAKTKSFGEGPVIVHCSAGVGRTGTFLALDYLLEQASSEGRIDVYECVKRLRYQRMNMVQNEGQYIFLHDLLALALTEGRKHPVIVHDHA